MKTIYDDKYLCLELLDNGNYRITMFNKNNHWSGDIEFNEDGVVYDDLSDDKCISNIDYVQVIPQSDEEKFKMYMSCSKEELAKMLIQANKTIEQMEKSFNNYSNSESTL